MAHWHGLAKLRVHTDLTLNIMDCVTVDLGKKLRAFQKETCTAFVTRELKRERDARIRRTHKSKVNSSPGPSPESIASAPCPSSAAGATSPPVSAGCHVDGTHDRTALAKPIVRDTTRRPKTFNLNTYKLHALGNYTTTIRRNGTTDSYSTEVVSLTCRRSDPSFIYVMSGRT